MRSSFRSPLREPRSRGFTLLEIMVVVVMVGILAALAVPSINYQMKSNRTYRAAQEVAVLFRQAKVRAMGRGSAVLLRFSRDATTAGNIQVLEGVFPAAVGGEGGVAEACRTPRASCQQTNWNDESSFRVISTFRPGEGLYENITMTLEQGTGDDATALTSSEFCFTPIGRLHHRTNVARFTPLPTVNGAPFSIRVERTDGVSFPRRVLLPTNGAASIVAVTP